MSNQDADRERKMGQALVVIAAIAWSSAGFFTRLIEADALSMVFWRGIFGGGFIALYLACHWRWRLIDEIKAMGRAGWLIVLCGVVCLVAFIPALKFTSVANVAVIYATTPFMTAALAWLWFREPASFATLFASLLALGGVAIAVSGSTFGGRGSGDLLGIGLAFVMTLAMALYMVACRRYRQKSLLPGTAIANLLSAVVILPFALPPFVGPADLGYLALFGLCQMAVGASCFTIGSKMLPAAQSALIGALETPLAPFWVWIAFAEVPSHETLIGGTIVMTAVLGHILFERLGGGRLTARELGRPVGYAKPR